jgi:hypothetical protein
MCLLTRIAPVVLCLAAVPTYGQGRLAAQNILPDTFSSWTATGHQSFNSANQASSNGATTGATADPARAASAAREYGFVAGETSTYAHAAAAASQAPGSLSVTLYRMKDPSGAYGEYSYLRTPDMDRANFTEHSSMKANEALVLAGNLVLDVQGPDVHREGSDITALVSSVATKAREGLYPILPTHMPDDNRVAGSDHYILGPATLDQFFPGGIGNSLGFSYGTEVETAHFHLDGNDATMLIADFPTPQIAQSQLDLLSKKFNINGSQPTGAAPPLFAQRSQTLVSIVAGAPSSDSANKLLDQVQSGTVLTWNEPTFQFKEPSFSVMVVGAFVGTGTICLFAAVGSLAFGGVRLAIKRMFPNTIFDRSAQIDIMQLGLVSKPIKAEDFYSYDGKRIDTGTVDKNIPDRTALRLFK